MIKKISIFAASFFLLLILVRPSYARCSDTRPVDKPVFLNAQPGDRSVTLTWQGVPDPVTYYLLQYGPAKDSMIYGNPNIGGRGATSYTVTELQNGVKYYFQMRAGNGCRPGKYSDTITAIPGNQVQLTPVFQKPKNLSLYKNVLGANTSPTENAKKGATKNAFPAPKKKKTIDSCASRCHGLTLLIFEIITLSTLFLIASRRKSIKPIYSIFIPLATIAIFYAANGKCGLYSFYCRYFTPLTIITYVFMLIAQKYVLINTGNKAK